MRETLFVTKSDGRQEPFSMAKFERSLKRAGVPKEHIRQVFGKIMPQIKPGISTQELYKETYQTLATLEQTCASRYSLKQALRMLGPSGFPFELLVGQLLEYQGYTTVRDQYIDGKCVSHEIDIVATKGDETMMVECKFHGRIGIKSDVKVTLYMKARFDDIAAKESNKITQCMIATNTQFTSEAISYAECVGLTLLAWGYPHNKGLESLIEENKLYPITVLSNIKKHDLAALIAAGIIFCKDLIENRQLLESKGLRPPVISDIIRQCKDLC